MEKNTLQNALNELSKGTTDNIDSIMIRDAAGNQYWIAKSDLASVLGELLSSNKLYPYMNRGLCGDFNNSLEHGYYVVSNATNNIPSNAYSYGILEVFGASNFLVQRYTPHANYSGNYGEYTRVRYNDKWGEWRFIPYQ